MSIYIGSNRYKAMVGSSRADFVTKKALPYDAEIEYIESTGTQLIDTGISGGSDCEYEVVFKALQGSTNYRVFVGATLRENALPKLYWYSTIQTQWWNGTGTVSKNFGNADVKYKVSYKEGSLYRDDVLLYTMGTSGIGSKNFCAFGYLAESGTFSTKMQLYSLKLWKDGTLVRDMIPCRVEQIGYMYDKISGTLFGNAGTGDFILGNDKN